MSQAVAKGMGILRMQTLAMGERPWCRKQTGDRHEEGGWERDNGVYDDGLANVCWVA